MGNAYLMLLMSLFVDGAFGTQCSDPVKMRELMEGEAVLLDTCVSKIQKEDEIEWKFGARAIASIKASNALYGTDNAIFKDKLQINEQTGDLTIRNTRIEHSGVYEVKITNITHTTHRTFKVTVLDPIPKKVSAAEGELIALSPNIADVEIYHLIEWKFEDEETPIAQINLQKSKDPEYDENNERFHARLKLHPNGSLTITNATATDSGLYKLQVTGNNEAGKHRRFRVVVSEPVSFTLPMVVISLLCAVGVIGVAAVCWYLCKQRSANSNRTENTRMKELY